MTLKKNKKIKIKKIGTYPQFKPVYEKDVYNYISKLKNRITKYLNIFRPKISTLIPL